MKTARTLASLLVIGVAAGCTDTFESSTTTWEAEFPSLGPASVSGSVGVLSQASRSEVSIAIVGANVDSTYSWDLRRGDCGEAGEILAGPAVYPVLSPDPAGAASAETAISESLEAGGAYSARLRFENTAGDIACAALRRTN